MTAPSYTEDLTDIATGDEGAGWVELTGTGVGDGEVYSVQGPPAYSDPDYPYIQGQYSVTQDCTKDASIGSLAYNVAAITVPTDGAVFVWQNYMVASNIYNYATGGFRICIGSGLNDFDVYFVGGVDKSPYPYGGWDCQVANPTVTRDDYAGTPTGTINYVGGAVYVTTGSSKGEIHNVDAMRYGRGSAIFEFGNAPDGYATIPGFAAQNDLNANRWGLIQETAGGYLWQGRMQLGSVSNPVDFRDSDRNIFIKWTPKVTPNFNLIEIINSGSNIIMDGFTFQVLDTTTASKGRLLMTDPASASFISCQFIDMDTFVFNKSTNPVTINSCTFKRCGSVAQGNASFDSCVFNESTAWVAVSADNIESITNCQFTSDGTGHAIVLTSDHIQGGEYNLTNLEYTGYASVSGSTGNEVIYNNSGNLVTLYIVGGDYPSVRNGDDADTIIIQATTYTLTGVVSGSEIQIVPQDWYLDGTVTADEDLYHLENTTIDDGSGRGTTKATYTYNYSGDIPIYVYIHKLGYEWTRILDTLTNTNKSVPVSQKVDRVESNPK